MYKRIAAIAFFLALGLSPAVAQTTAKPAIKPKPAVAQTTAKPAIKPKPAVAQTTAKPAIKPKPEPFTTGSRPASDVGTTPNVGSQQWKKEQAENERKEQHLKEHN
jgi:hypothetical protein